MNRHLTIALVGPAAPPAGGMSALTAQLHELLLQEGVDVRFLQTNSPYQPDWLANIKGLRAGARLWQYLRSLWKLLDEVDVVHIMANSGWSWQLFCAPVIWLGKLRACPVIVNYHGGEADSYLAKSFRWVKPSLDRMDTLVVPSSYLQQIFDNYGYHAKVIPNIVDTHRFQPAAVAKPAGSLPRIVVVRNLEKIYGIDCALTVLAKLRDAGVICQLAIAGSGPEKSQLQQLATQLQLSSQVEFLGRLDRDQVAALYQQADIFLNVSRVDNMPISLLEAMASGVPIVTTSAGGIPWMVEHEKTALLCPIDDTTSLADAIQRLIHDKTLRDEFIHNGLGTVQSYSWQQVKDQWLKLYQQCSQLQIPNFQNASR